MLRLALIGCGAHSEAAHAASLAHYVSQHPGEVELVAACDLRRERAERFCCDYGFADAYTDVETMLATAIPDPGGEDRGSKRLAAAPASALRDREAARAVAGRSRVAGYPRARDRHTAHGLPQPPLQPLSEPGPRVEPGARAASLYRCPDAAPCP